MNRREGEFGVVGEFQADDAFGKFNHEPHVERNSPSSDASSGVEEAHEFGDFEAVGGGERNGDVAKVVVGANRRAIAGQNDGIVDAGEGGEGAANMRLLRVWRGREDPLSWGCGRVGLEDPVVAVV